jgi:hypothetical protein
MCALSVVFRTGRVVRSAVVAGLPDNLFSFHPYIGLAALFGAIIPRHHADDGDNDHEPTRAATGHALARNALAEMSRRNSEGLRRWV